MIIVDQVQSALNSIVISYRFGWPALIYQIWRNMIGLVSNGQVKIMLTYFLYARYAMHMLCNKVK